jgi:serine/threonine-protein kinase
MKAKLFLAALTGIVFSATQCSQLVAAETRASQVKRQGPSQDVRNALRTGNFEQAIQLLTAIIQSNPSKIEPYLERAIVYCISRNAKLALADCDRAISIDPTDSRGYQLRAEVESLLRDKNDAIADASQAVQLKPSPATYIVRAECYLRMNQPDNAIADCNSALQLSQSCAAAYYVRCIADIYKRQLDAALQDITTAIELKPITTGYTLRALLWSVKRDYTRANQDYDTVAANPKATPFDLNEAAKFYISCPNPQFRNAAKAVDCAAEACDRTGCRVTKFVDTYADACAMAGDFDLAVEYENMCVNDKNAPAQIRKMYAYKLAMYQQHKTLPLPN